MYTCKKTCFFPWPGKKIQKALVQDGSLVHIQYNIRSIPALIAQDTVEELGAMGTSAVDDFDWLVQLRYYIEAMGSWK